MNRSNNTSWMIAFAGVILLPLSMPASAGLVTVRFDPPDQTVNVGDTFTIGIVADISDPVVGWGLDVNAVMRNVISPVGAPAIGPLWVPAYTPDGDGLAGLAFSASVSGPGVLLATLTFHADDIGEADLNASVTPGDPWEGFALDPSGFATLAFEPGHIIVTPEPAAAIFLGIAALFLARRRR